MLRIIELPSLRTRSRNSFVAGRTCRQILTVAAMLSLVTFAAIAHAAPINYGNFSGNTVDYLNVSEDANSAGDAPPLFGPPTASGDSLDFDPVGFNASASGAAGIDVTDGNLNFVIMAKQGYAVDMVSLAEAGDTTLAGFGNDSTFTSVTGIGVLNVLEVDGVGIAPIAVPINLVFTPSGGTYGLATDGGGGPLFSSGWSGSWLKDVEQVLIDNNVAYTLGATKVSINLDNTLTALSQEGTFALIAKKDFGGLSVTVNIPEPATWFLASVCGLAAAFTGRRR
ncbi:MAG: PEP-CTERM sorting domain-containing protein [Pirellulales bacterium]